MIENGAARVILSQEVLKQYNVTDAETAAIVRCTWILLLKLSLWEFFVEQADGLPVHINHFFFFFHPIA